MRESSIGCLAQMRLAGKVDIAWSGSTDTTGGDAVAQLSGELSGDSTRAVPIHVTANVGGKAVLSVNTIEFLPSRADIRVDILFRARNSRVDQRIRQTVVYSLVRRN
ncbi:MAG: hypothetical protein ACT4OZ_06430 [Gemmatimonadota bacterium]